MEPKSKLNRAKRSGVFLFLGIILSVGLLYGRLAVLYAPVPLTIQRPPEIIDETRVTQRSGRREDAELFDQALVLGLLRVDRAGRIAVAPADLPLRQRWASDHPDLLAPPGEEPNWLDSPWDDEVSRWHRALHFSAAGRYVRQQIEAFNAQRPEFPHIQQRDGRLFWRDRH
jgi:hypothetical protein